MVELQNLFFDMNKAFNVITIVFLVLIFTGCAPRPNVPSKEERIVIMDDEYYHIFGSDGKRAYKVRRPSKTRNTFYSYRFAQTDDDGMASPCLGGEPNKYYLEIFEADSLQVDIAPIPSATLNSFFKEDDTFITINNQNTALSVSISDLKGNILKQKVVKFESESAHKLIDYSLIPDSEGYYLLAMLVPVNTATPYVENHLFHLNDDLEIDKDINLNINNGGCFSMVIDQTNQIAYVLQTTEGTNLQTGEPGLSQRLHIIDIENEMIIEEVMLGYEGSSEMILDSVRNQIVIRRTSFWKDDNIQFLILDLSDFSIDVIEFDQAIIDEEFIHPIFSNQNGLYYILFQKVLFIYNPDTKDLKHLNMDSLDISKARGIWVGENIDFESTFTQID